MSQTNWKIAGILLLGAGLRLWGITWGFPLQRAYIDEFASVFYTMQLFQTGPHPLFFDYPSFYLYLLWFTIAISQFLTGNPELTLEAFVNMGSVLPIAVGRLLNVLLAVVTIWIVYKTGRLWKGEKVGMLAALLFALHPVHVRMSHYAMPDILAVTLLAGGTLAWLIYLNTGKAPPLFFSSISIGLSAASKYTPGLVAAGLVFWLASNRRWKHAALFSACLMAGFFLGAPYTILDLTGFVSRLAHLSEFFLIGHGETPNLPQRFIQTILFLPSAFGFGILVLALIGVWRQRDPWTFSMGLGVLFYIFCLGFWTGRAPRYFLVLTPILCLWAGAALNWALSADRYTLKYAGWGALCACLMTLVWPNYQFLKLISQKDTRLIAYDWIRSHLQHESKILRFPHTPEFKNEDQFYVEVDWEGQKIQVSPTELLKSYDFLITAHFESEPAEWERRLENELDSVYNKALPTPQFPHQPRVRVWTQLNPN